MTAKKRLHVSPLNSQLLPVVLPESLLEKASDVSLHTIQTFPEKGFGYIELPEMEADKLRKKLNGSTLKGSKMRVEEARPEKVRRGVGNPDGETSDADQARTKEKTKSREKPREEGNKDSVIQGHELRDRKVKRGWTESAEKSRHLKKNREKGDKKSKAKAPSFTGEAECLFKTALPPTAATSRNTKDGKVKKRKRGDLNRDTVVHEFANTTKHPQFLRDTHNGKGMSSAATYSEEKGWIDEHGNVVEAVPKKKRKPVDQASPEARENGNSETRRTKRSRAVSTKPADAEKHSHNAPIVGDETSSSGSSTSENESEPDGVEKLPSPSESTPNLRSKWQKQNMGAGEDNEVDTDQVERLSITRSSASPPPTNKLPPKSVPSGPEVHPLEALFKRPKTAASDTPKRPNLEVSTAFSFFDQDIDEGENQGLVVPQTPFTQQDIRQRRQRSAAPTPDTAAPGRTFGNIWEGTSDVSGGEDDMEADAIIESKGKSATPEIKEEKPESDFSKWFWEHRGENNRAWKRRRREAAKEKRQKENKQRKG